MTTASRRLVRLITRLNIGGPARQALLLTRELTEWKTILAAGRPRPDEGELIDPSVPVRTVPLVRPINVASDARALSAVRSMLLAHRPHVVHTHMAKAGTIGRLAALSVRPRPALVHTYHGHVLEGYFRPTAQKVFIEVERALARRTDRLIAVSEHVRDELLELGIGRPEQYRVVALGLDLDRHRAEPKPGGLRRALGVDPETPLVGVVGRLVPIKDHELLLRAMDLVPGAHLAVVGDGQLRSSLEAFVTSRPGLRERVHFAGWWSDVPAVMADLDVVVLTSRNEGTPVSLIEAAACARPVVATDVGGVRSVVRDGVTGLVVPHGRPEPIADAISRLLEDPDLAASMGAEGRRASHGFDADRLVKDIRLLYNDLLQDRCR